MPSGQATVRGVRTRSRSTMKTCVALVSATKPRTSSISASSAPAMLASIFARIDWIRLLWWILGSRQSGAKRLMLAVTSEMPSRGYTGGLCSASTMSVGPDVLSRGSMPEVIFTPRVSVRRMWTPSNIAFASSVLRIWPMISARGGIVSNASALADSTNRSRCCSSRKMRPEYRRSPSHTASPPCTTESNGLTPASSRCTSRPATLTIRLRLRSSKGCCTRRPLRTQSVRPELVIQGPALRLDRLKLRRQSCGRSRRWCLEAGRLLDARVPPWRPDPVGVSPAGRPGEHPLAERHVERLAEPPQHRLGCREQIRRVHDRGHTPGRRQHVIEDLDLLRQPCVGERAFLELLGERHQHRARVADQECIGHPGEPLAPDIRQQVMRHLLLVEDARSRGLRPEQHLDDAPLVRFVMRDHLLASRMRSPGDCEVVRIQRLVDDDRVLAVPPGPHQRGRDVAWSRPHRESQHAVAVSGQPCGTGR